MARINETTGMLTGAIGPVVASSWRGIKVLKSKGKLSSKPKTAKQLEHQSKVGLISTFVYSMKELLEQTFAGFAIKKTGTNAAFSYNFKNCIAGEYPSYYIDHSRALISRGDLVKATDAVVMNVPDGLQFSWGSSGGGRPGDLAVCVAHCPELKGIIYSIGPATRLTGSSVLDLPQFKGKKTETWLAFIAAANKDSADSVYTGSFLVD